MWLKAVLGDVGVAKTGDAQAREAMFDRIFGKSKLQVISGNQDLMERYASEIR